MPRFRGTPRELDTFLEPAVRYTLLAVSIPIVAVLWWFEAWWWLPVPVIAAAGLHTAVFWARADRPAELVLEPDSIVLHDPRRGDPVQLDVGNITVASLFLRGGREGTTAVVLLADDTTPQLGVQLALTRRPAVPHAIDVDLADEVLGGQAGILRAVTPLERTARQVFARPAALDWLLTHVPSEAWRRTGLRLWHGAAPTLSPFGFHVADADAWLVLDGPAWTMRWTDGAKAEGTLESAACTHATRTIEIMVATDEGPKPEPAQIALLTLALAPNLVVSFPAPVAAARVPAAGLAEHGFHCHPPEGAALVEHLRRVLDPALLPEALRAAPESR